MDLILFGIQGSGKGTQAEKIAEKYNLEIFETGARLRALAQKNSALGKKVKSIIEAGHLVPNEVVIEIVENFIQKIPEGKSILFDGIPRSMKQKESLEKIFQEFGRETKALLINISKEEAIKRLTTRRICKECKATYPVFYKKERCEKCSGKLIVRTDDNIESIETRLDAYEKETLPVIEEYRNEQRLIEVDGEKSIEEVSEEVFGKLNLIYNKKQGYK